MCDLCKDIVDTSYNNHIICIKKFVDNKSTNNYEYKTSFDIAVLKEYIHIACVIFPIIKKDYLSEIILTLIRYNKLVLLRMLLTDNSYRFDNYLLHEQVTNENYECVKFICSKIRTTRKYGDNGEIISKVLKMYNNNSDMPNLVRNLYNVGFGFKLDNLNYLNLYGNYMNLDIFKILYNEFLEEDNSSTCYQERLYKQIDNPRMSDCSYGDLSPEQYDCNGDNIYYSDCEDEDWEYLIYARPKLFDMVANNEYSTYIEWLIGENCPFSKDKIKYMEIYWTKVNEKIQEFIIPDIVKNIIIHYLDYSKLFKYESYGTITYDIN